MSRGDGNPLWIPRGTTPWLQPWSEKIVRYNEVRPGEKWSEARLEEKRSEKKSEVKWSEKRREVKWEVRWEEKRRDKNRKDMIQCYESPLLKDSHPCPPWAQNNMNLNFKDACFFPDNLFSEFPVLIDSHSSVLGMHSSMNIIEQVLTIRYNSIKGTMADPCQAQTIAPDLPVVSTRPLRPSKSSWASSNDGKHKVKEAHIWSYMYACLQVYIQYAVFVNPCFFSGFGCLRCIALSYCIILSVYI